MAKIFLITRERNSTVKSLLESLETDQQPFYVHLTGEPSPRNLFLIWASFLRIKPDLAYFVFEDDKLNWMERALIETMGALPFQNTAATFIGPIDCKKSKSLQRFIRHVDLLTLPSRQNLSELRGLSSSNRRQLRALLPPFPPISSEASALNSSELELLKYIHGQSLWILPWNKDYFETHHSFLESVAKQKTWVFLANRTNWKFHDFENFREKTRHWKNQPLWAGQLGAGAIEKVFEQAEVILLAGLNCRPSEYVQWASLAVHSGLFAILDTHQVELFSGLWAVHENCELIERDFVQQELENRWMAGSLVPQQIRRKPRSPVKALDESLNELNRWITKTLTYRKMA